jgi:hypothetical protein
MDAIQARDRGARGYFRWTGDWDGAKQMRETAWMLTAPDRENVDWGGRVPLYCWSCGTPLADLVVWWSDSMNCELHGPRDGDDVPAVDWGHEEVCECGRIVRSFPRYANPDSVGGRHRVHCSHACGKRTARRERRRRMLALAPRVCAREGCENPVTGRADQKWCSGRCRTAHARLTADV